MNKLVRSLLSGASLATLQLCAIGGAARAGTTISANRGAYTNPAGATTDFILINNNAIVSGDVTNDGTVGVSGTAIDVTGGATITGSLINSASGIITATETGIRIDSSATVVGGVQNAGQILVTNSQFNNGSATAGGVAYYSVNGTNVSNNGTLSIKAVMTMTNDGYGADAYAYGIFESANNANGTGATNVLTNTGNITLTASAKVTDSYYVDPYAYAESALKQVARDGSNITETLTNSGNLSLSAKAVAIDGYSADYAYAYAGSAIKQAASNNSTHPGTAITLNVTNSGNISMNATATVTSADGYAKAYAEHGIIQYADNAATITETLSNNGSLSLTANAKATNNVYDVDVKAFASSALKQGAYGAGNITETLTNSGNLSLNANAVSTGDEYYGYAYAYAEGAIRQYAANYYTTPSDSVSLTVNNSGDIAMSANASAHDGYYYYDAYADAYVESAIEQYVRNADVINETITNNGTLTINAAANAGQITGSTASSYSYGYAYARATNIVAQYVNRSGSTLGTSVAQNITNSGNLSISLAASVTRADVGYYAYTGYADATAKNLFHQYAEDAADITQSVTNSGAIGITADANMTVANGEYVEEWNYARARASLLFDQDAYNATNATLSIDNSGPIAINLTATANVSNFYYGYYQEASAYAWNLFDQYAYAVNANLTAVNSGSLTLNLNATETENSNYNVEYLDAYAGAWDIFSQYVDATNATLSIENSGALSVNATAVVTGGSNSDYGYDLYADASAGDVFKQYANATDAALSITNTAPITLNLTATVADKASNYIEYEYAYADAAKLFTQWVDGGANGTASESIVNSGNVTINGVATTNGRGYDSYAEATATKLFYQYAEGGNITQSITNSASLNVNLAANAKGTRSIYAYANLSSGQFKQYADGSGAIEQTLTNSGTLTFNLTANVNTGGRGDAYASADSLLWQSAEGFATGSNPNTSSANMTVTNSGTIAINATATDTSLSDGYAASEFNAIIGQEAYGVNTVSETIANAGNVSLTQLARASGTDVEARVSASGFWQSAEGASNATLSVVNSGNLSVKGTASAIGTTYASAYAWHRGVSQELNHSGSSAVVQTGTLSVDNTGTIEVASVANAAFAANGYVEASATGVEQRFEYLSGNSTINNSGTIDVAATATVLPATLATGVTPATSTELPVAHAQAYGVLVNAYGEDYVKNWTYYGVTGTDTVHYPSTPSVDISNSGTINVAASASAPVTFTAADINATAAGVAVWASSKIGVTRTYNNSNGVYTNNYVDHYTGSTVTGAIDNSGTISVSASAPSGEAIAGGIWVASGNDGASITNETGGTVSVSATGAIALAAGIEVNDPNYGYSYGYHQTSDSKQYHRTTTRLYGPAANVTGNITNDGTINVNATADGTYIGDYYNGYYNYAAVNPSTPLSVRADGIAVNALNVTGNILNAGTINVAATGAGAMANGIHVFASQTGTRDTSYKQVVYSTANSTWMKTTGHGASALHTAIGGNTLSGNVTNSGTLNVSATGAGAAAKGINIVVDTLNGAVVNTGTINVAATGDGATAEGIVIDATTLGANASLQNNGGTISASVNGVRGTAIDVSAAPNSLVLALNGGSIYGNIVENAAGNAITIDSGNLQLDGLINPSGDKLGSLTVGTNGTLTLLNNAAEGSAMAYVNTFTQNGTLAIVGSADGTSGQIHAGAATLSGPAVVNIDPNVVYGASTTYRVVFSDAALSGTWSSVSPSADSTFFSATGVYSTNEADITLTRAAFDDIEGLTANEKSVGGAIETIYDGGATGSLHDLINALFGLTPAQYADALEQLSGIPVAELSETDLASLQSFMDQVMDHLGDPSTSGGATASLSGATNVAGLAPADASPAQLGDMSGTRVWGGAFQSSHSVDRTASGPGYQSHQNGLLAGVDMPVAPNFLVGVAAGWTTGDFDTDQHGAVGSFSSGQVAGYARYTGDNGVYALGNVSYGSYSNEIHRYVSIPGFGSGTANGSFDTTAWGLYGEVGWHLNPEGWSMNVTPYAALSYLDATSDGYTETGTFGAPLTIHSSSSRATSSYLGVKLSEDFATGNAIITPHLTAAWQHDFTDTAWQMSAAFAAAPTVGFGLTGSDLSKDGAYVDGGVTLHIDSQVDVLLDYQGRFTSDRSDSSLLARANFKF